MSKEEDTLGKYRVGVTFNPSQDETVKAIKEHTAALIDLAQSIPGNFAELSRLKAVASTKNEEAAMWAVKAATKKTPKK